MIERSESVWLGRTASGQKPNSGSKSN
ncbi:protein of unknown function [Methylocella tundrae]|uniref:Uncharacterized protein n=1 Tax=Methylocella tundrae TaxID=227605 RepID=A0A4U8YTS2_METTU|nr:protein of unknown function [Methylocella tundrae]